MAFLRSFMRRLRDGEVKVSTCGHDNARWISQHARTLLCDECDWYERMEDKAQDFMWWAVRR